MSSNCQITAGQGRYGFVVANGIRMARITRWELRFHSEPFLWNDQAAMGTMWSIATAKSLTGRIEAHIRGPEPQTIVIFEGASVVLDLYMDDTSFIRADTTIGDVGFNVDIQSGVVNTVEASFVGNGYFLIARNMRPVNFDLAVAALDAQQQLGFNVQSFVNLAFRTS